MALGVASFAIQIPYLDLGLSLLDEGSVLAVADAVARGAVLYGEHRTPLAPLTYQLFGMLMRCFGSDLQVARLAQAGIFTATTLLVVVILRRVSGERWALGGGLAMLALKPIAYPLWTIANYSQLGMLFVLTAVWCWLHALPERRTGWTVAAGLCIGLAGITKQNLGAVVALAIASAALLDFGLGRDGLRGALRRAGALVGPALLPLLVEIVVCASHGAADDFFRQAVLGVLELPDAWGLSLPPIGPWSGSDMTAGLLAFAYFPPAIVDMIFSERIALRSRLLFPGMETVVKIAYYGPGLCALAVAWSVARGLGASARDRVATASRATILLVALLAYASMLYRADWAHLMNIAPPLIVLAVLAVSDRAPRSLWLGAPVLLGWSALGAGLAFAVLRGPFGSVESAAGALRTQPASARATAEILRWVADRSDHERIVFAPAQPLYYFLSRRPLPLSQDLLLPGAFVDDGDAHIERELERVDTVIYSSSLPFFVNQQITEYAPRTAARLRSRFAIEGILSGSTVALRQRAASAPPPEDVRDVFAEIAEGEIPHAVAETWMFYRVALVPLRRTMTTGCFAFRHTPRGGDRIEVTPMLHPDSWRPATAAHSTAPSRGAAVAAGLFSISVETASERAEPIFAQELRADRLPERIALPLSAWAGRPIELRLCAGRSGTAALAQGGWSELVLRAAAAPLSDSY